MSTEAGHISIPVTVDGRKLIAIIDTGASHTSMSMDIAQRVFDLMPQSPDMTSVDHLSGDENAVIYRYTFANLSFEGGSCEQS
jgi:hypothetical protein